jgi:glyoxylase I family protein
MPKLMGISHVDLTVSDCEQAAAWWQDVLGFTVVHQARNETIEARAMVHPSGIGVTVMTHNGTAAGGEFDERRVGLDHLAFRVADQTELERWVTRLDDKGVTHSGIIDIGFGPTVVFRDLDNIQLEFYVHGNAHVAQLREADSGEARQVLDEALATEERALNRN